LLLFLASIGFGNESNDIPLLQWAGPPGSRPGTYEEWIAEHPPKTFSTALLTRVESGTREGTALILVEESLASSLAEELSGYAEDLSGQGYSVLTYEITGGTPEDLRGFLADVYDSIGLSGALFIGDLPVAWYEMGAWARDSRYEEFPCDLYYMDLNGTWLDTMWTGNGKFDGHSGDLNPEIYVGRLVPRGIGDDTLLLENYFRKNREYRHHSEVELERRALVFCDDDWVPWSVQWGIDVSLLYPDTMNYFHPDTTCASVYRARLDTVQAWVSVFAHSWPGGHQFTHSGGSAHDYYYSEEYTTQDPPGNFYNHFACSFSRYTEDGCGGARSIFNPSFGLGEIGSTKSGSMLRFEYFYAPLGAGNTLGEAYREWFTEITHDGVTLDEIGWHYGMTLMGDPWLLPVGHAAEICGDADGNGIRTPGDAYRVLNYLGSGPEPASCWSANVNGDSVLTTGDGYRLLNWLGGESDLDCAPCTF
jgi:hypothetical protein